jgi:hypothetical protein
MKNDSLLNLTMHSETKIQLSSFEMDLLNNSEWILTKNIIVKKAHHLLEQVQQNIFDRTKEYSNVLPKEVINIFPKISKGENYKGLPWLMLDYPRCFNKENIFAIRTMFWWGHFFSTTLHLSGHYKSEYNDAILSAYDELCGKNFFICIHEEQWHHHFEEENYKALNKLTRSGFAEQIRNKTFIKLSTPLAFSQWDNAVKLLSENFEGIIKWMI